MEKKKCYKSVGMRALRSFIATFTAAVGTSLAQNPGQLSGAFNSDIGVIAGFFALPAVVAGLAAVLMAVDKYVRL